MSLDDAGRPAAAAAALSGSRKIPFWRTVVQAYALWAKNLPELVRACWLWLVLLAPFLAIVAWWRAPYLVALLKASGSDEFPPDPAPLLSIAATLLSLIVMLPAAASIAVAWHRLVLRNEQPGSNFYLRLDSVVVGYMLLLLATWVPSRALGLLRKGIGEDAVTFVLIGTLSFAIFFILPRLSLALPAAALQRSDVGFRAAWRASARNTWRMFGATMVCFLPVVIIGQVVVAWLPSEPSRITVALVSAASSLVAIPLGMIPVGLLSLAYRHFFERSE